MTANPERLLEFFVTVHIWRLLTTDVTFSVSWAKQNFF